LTAPLAGEEQFNQSILRRRRRRQTNILIVWTRDADRATDRTSKKPPWSDRIRDELVYRKRDLDSIRRSRQLRMIIKRSYYIDT
jgi:hypothetical protein